MKTPDLIASALVDGPNPADRTLPLIDSVPMEQAEGVCEGGYMDVLTVSRRAYRELVAAAVREALAERDAEVGRLKRGDFTAAEVHDICHNLPGTVPASEFAAGCAAEQRKLYGCAPDADEVARLRAEVKRLAAERDHHEQQQRALLYGDLPKLRAERDEFFRQRCDLLHERDRLAAEVATLREQVTGHCERIHAQSDLLSKRAERPG